MSYAVAALFAFGGIAFICALIWIHDQFVGKSRDWAERDGLLNREDETE